MSTIADTAAGRIEGIEENGLCVFRGIPYAAPPVGELRFRAPQPVEAWADVRPANRFGPIARQQSMEMLEALLPPPETPQSQSEDCLYLNVWTPVLDGAVRPVMVWIHGGAFTIGSGSEDYYNGANLAARGDVVVVTINYRLGAFGFLNLPALGETNFGMRDQIAALQWVQANIANFGGNPGNVTIFGESAGGMSVGSLMASPEATGLFHKAIPQSGAAHNALSMAETEATGCQFAEALGIAPDDVKALRSADADDILSASVAVDPIASEDLSGAQSPVPQMPFQPVIDGQFLQKMPIEHIREGSAAGIATFVGALDEEMKLLAAAGSDASPPDADAVIGMLSTIHPDSAGAYASYRAARRERGEDDSPGEIMIAVIGDYMLRLPGLRLADAQTGQAPTYVYLFDWKSPIMGGALGSCHALELPFVFGTHDKAPDFAGSGSEADTLAELTMDIWLAFARSGDPSTPAVDVPSWNPETKPIIVLGSNPRIEHGWRASELSVWDNVLA